jgi:hypothetical protein
MEVKIATWSKSLCTDMYDAVQNSKERDFREFTATKNAIKIVTVERKLIVSFWADPSGPLKKASTIMVLFLCPILFT